MKILAYIVGGIVAVILLISTFEIWAPIAMIALVIWILWATNKDDVKEGGLKSTLEGKAMKAQNQAMKNQADKMNSAMNKMDDEI
ncbi:MAG: hypothetical protein UFS73_02260 [Weissella confusa]|nr:hypothetical protein [Weissella confusa]